MDSWGLEGFLKYKVKNKHYSSFGQPNLDMCFILYLFDVEEKFTTIITQQNHKGDYIPISFMSRGLKDYDLKYSPMEKQVFYMVKDVSHLKYVALKVADSKQPIQFVEENIFSRFGFP